MRLIDADKMIADLLTVDPQYETMIDWCIRVTEAQPTVEPDRKKGEWIWKIWSKYQCSGCGYVTNVDECMEEPMYNYCPYCGADMRGR